MILVDINIPIYATSENTTHHRAARTWFEAQLNGSTKVGLLWNCLIGFLRIATNKRALSKAITCSTDGDFARFPGLRWTNPLAG